MLDCVRSATLLEIDLALLREFINEANNHFLVLEKLNESIKL